MTDPICLLLFANSQSDSILCPCIDRLGAYCFTFVSLPVCLTVYRFKPLPREKDFFPFPTMISKAFFFGVTNI